MRRRRRRRSCPRRVVLADLAAVGLDLAREGRRRLVGHADVVAAVVAAARRCRRRHVPSAVARRSAAGRAGRRSTAGRRHADAARRRLASLARSIAARVSRSGYSPSASGWPRKPLPEITSPLGADLDVGDQARRHAVDPGSTVTNQRRTRLRRSTRAPSTSAPLAATTSSAIGARLLLGSGRSGGSRSGGRRPARTGSSPQRPGDGRSRSRRRRRHDASAHGSSTRAASVVVRRLTHSTPSRRLAVDAPSRRGCARTPLDAARSVGAARAPSARPQPDAAVAPVRRRPRRSTSSRPRRRRRRPTTSRPAVRLDVAVEAERVGERADLGLVDLAAQAVGGGLAAERREVVAGDVGDPGEHRGVGRRLARRRSGRAGQVDREARDAGCRRRRRR